jgi:hypothetical protein
MSATGMPINLNNVIGNNDSYGLDWFLGSNNSNPISIDTMMQPRQDKPTGLESLGGFAGIANILGGIGGLYNAFNTNKLMKDSLKFQKNVYSTNIKNQTAAYNTNLEDRIKARYATQGNSQDVNSYLQQNKI